MSGVRGLERYKSQEQRGREEERHQRHRLVEEHGSMVRRVASRIMRRLPGHARVFEEEDLVSVGILGLFDAWERYDPARGRPFDVFAEFRVKGMILDEIRRHDFFPRRLREKANRVETAEGQLWAQQGRKPTVQELAQALGMEVKELQQLRSKIAPYRLVAPEDDSVTLRTPRLDALEQLEERFQREELARALERLPPREQLVLDLMFNRELTGAEIARVMELSEGRVSQLKSKALATLREAMS